ncbi:MAG: DUF92 domain-containing protein [Chitinophagaceae bacterium]|nr:DUF92 domain-containing protein [Chitinophagaceae bacterium]
MHSSYYIVFLIVALGAALSVYKGKLTQFAAITGSAAAIVIFSAAGISGIVLLTAFFIMGVTATAHQWKNKKQHRLVDNDKGQRTAGQVLANSGMAVILSIFILSGHIDLHKGLLMIAGSFAAAAADTVSSELGNAYGRRFYDIVSFKKAARGVNGAISTEGTLWGIAASFLISLIYLATTAWEPVYIPIIVVAGTLGNIADSILGATLENRKFLGNNTVNFINTGVGAAVSLLLSCLLIQ